MVSGHSRCQAAAANRSLQVHCPFGSSVNKLPVTQQLPCKQPLWLLRRREGLCSCCNTTAHVANTSSSSIASCGTSVQQTLNNCSGWQRSNRASTPSRTACSHLQPQHPQHRLATRASASGSSAGDGSSSSSSSASGLLGVLQKWNQDTHKLREQLQSLGIAGVVAYGLFNTLYYTVAFLVVWFTVSNVPAGLGAQAAMRKAAEVFALVWAGSQVTKLLRAGGALACAPVVDKGLEFAVQKFGLKSKQQAFALVVAACLALAAVVFGAVVALHM